VRGVAAGARAARRGLRASDALRPLEARRTVAGTPRRYAPPFAPPAGPPTAERELRCYSGKRFRRAATGLPVYR